MAPISQQIANMVEMLPETEQGLALELVKRLVLAWDPDFTKVTPSEALELRQAETEFDNGETVDHDAINWD